MATRQLSTADSAQLPIVRSLLVIWQNPSTRRFSRIGQLDHLADGRYAFRYLREAVEDPDFFALDEYPEGHAVYVSDALPAFFANRVMSSERPSYGDHLRWLGIGGEVPPDVPMEVLARTGGPRETDTFHIVDTPRLHEHRFVTRFFVSGVKYCEGSEELLRMLSPEALLELRPEPDNPENPAAVLIDVVKGRPVGWVPDWLVGELGPLLESNSALRIVAEQINLDAPWNLRLLCRLEGGG